jgi:hypothetical protein
MQSPLYYECHITLDPVDEATLQTLKSICEDYEFKVAKLYLDKESTKPNTLDYFTTGRSANHRDLELRMIQLILKLKSCGFVVRQYKIESALLDSRVKDRLGLLYTNAQFPPLDAATQAILAKSFKGVDLGKPNWERVLVSNFLRAALVQAGTEDLWVNLTELTKKLEGQPSNNPNP